MTQKKDIWHIFSTLAVGGPQRRFADFIERSQEDHVHHVYAMDGRYESLALMGDKEPLHDGEQVIVKGNTLAATIKCRSFLKDHNPDLLVTYNWGATEWVLANSFFPICPTIHVQDGFAEDEQNGELTPRRLLRSFAYKRCAKVIVPSRTLHAVAKESWGIADSKLSFIPNGIELDRFAKPADNEFCEKLGLDSSKKTIGTLAALRPEKNIGRLIEAFSIVEDDHPNCQLVIMGDGVGMSALKMLAERVCTKGRVIFTGGLSEPERILPALDIFALSSDTEQMPLSVIEAMATGLPVVSTDVGDIQQMVADENKSLIEGKDANILAKNLSGLLSNSDLPSKIGEANKTKAYSDYSLEQMVASYDQEFTKQLD